MVYPNNAYLRSQNYQNRSEGAPSGQMDADEMIPMIPKLRDFIIVII